MSFTKASNISFVPLIILDTGKAHRAAAKFMKWLCYVAIPGSKCQINNLSVAIGNARILIYIFLSQSFLSFYSYLLINYIYILANSVIVIVMCNCNVL